jgi:hypothetical protein
MRRQLCLRWRAQPQAASNALETHYGMVCALKHFIYAEQPAMALPYTMTLWVAYAEQGRETPESLQARRHP